VGYLYACRYVYPDGAFTLSVKELLDDAPTIGYLDEMVGKVAPLDGIGEVAFYTRNRSVVARKDNRSCSWTCPRHPRSSASRRSRLPQ
jgi:hypothetical protein